MKIIGIEHIGIAVKDLKTDAPFWKHILGIDHTHSEKVDSEGVLTEIYDTGKGKLELLKATSDNSPISKFLQKRGQGVHHLALCVDNLENAILYEKYENLAYGSLCAGLGFGNTSTTLGHALSYVFSNEGVSHGHALAFTTTVAHRFNDSVFYNRYKNLVRKLNFEEINLKQNLENAANLILLDRKHLDNNPKEISKSEIIKLLGIICDGKSFDDSF